MQEEQDRIAAMMTQMHGPEQKAQPVQKSGMTNADKKRNKKKK
jgi:hypothetical protein